MVDIEPFATVGDLRARWPEMPEDADDLAATLLEDASQFIVDTVPTALEASPNTLKRIVCAVVKRSMQVPEDMVGVSSANQQAGPYGAQRSFVNPHGDFYLTRLEKKALGFGKQRAYSVDLVTGEVTDD